MVIAVCINMQMKLRETTSKLRGGDLQLTSEICVLEREINEFPVEKVPGRVASSISPKDIERFCLV